MPPAYRVLLHPCQVDDGTTALDPLPHCDAVGLKDFDVAPTDRAHCYVCGEKIAKGLFRLCYRFKQSRQFSDVRKVHFPCASALPASSRTDDVLALRHWLSKKDLMGERRVALQQVLDQLL